MDLHSSYNKFLRKSRPKSLECPFCLEPFLNTTEESFKLHVESDHADALAGNPDPSTYIVDLFKAAKPISNRFVFFFTCKNGGFFLDESK